MEKEFVPYEIALDLKELGFDKPCFAYYEEGYPQYLRHKNNLISIKIYSVKDNEFLTPTFSQSFRFFREKHNLDSFVKHLYKSTIKVGYYFGIDYKGIGFQMDLDDYYKTYEEAELECLKKLIEIVKK